MYVRRVERAVIKKYGAASFEFVTKKIARDLLKNLVRLRSVKALWFLNTAELKDTRW